MSVAIPEFMKKIQFSGAAPPLILATSRHCSLSITEELLEWKSSGSRKRRLTAVGIRCVEHATLYPQKLALTSPTCGGRLVGIVPLRTKATEFSFSLVYGCKTTETN
jgi:hypothetical protein